MKLLCVILSLSMFGECQNLIEAPQPQPKVERTCGPKWMGGCWDYERPRLSWGETFKSPKWYVPAAFLFGSTVFDAEVTYQGSHYHHYKGNPNWNPCLEANPLMAKAPSRGELYGKNLAAAAAVSGLGAALVKLHRMPFEITWYGMAGYGTEEHMRGGIGWLTQCW